MSLTRRHFLGLLGAAPALAPVAALAVKREPATAITLSEMDAAFKAVAKQGFWRPFPRYFVPNRERFSFSEGTHCLLVARADNWVEGWYTSHHQGRRSRQGRLDVTLSDCKRMVQEGSRLEITAAEAEALLKPQYDHPSCTLTITKDTDWDDVDEESLRLVARAKADLIMSAASITMKRGHEA